MLRRHLTLVVIGVAAATGIVLATQAPQQQAPPQQPPRQSQELVLTISGEGGRARFAVPDFVALSNDPDTVAAAKTIGQVLWDDLDFEREFEMIPRDTYASIPAARSLADVPFDRWRELGADGLVIGTVQRTAEGLRVEVRLFQVRSRQSALSKEYTGSAKNPRIYAHTIADEIFQGQMGLRGVARTKLTFASDRDGDRLGGTVEERSVKEIYIADYDGANQIRVTTNRRLNITPTWSPDARSIAYTSYRRGFPDIFIAHIYTGAEPETPARGQGHNFLPAWSPDGTRLAFMSNRDGNPEIYVMNRDGSGVRRVTNHPGIDVSPTWSPTGTQLAFVSDRTGSPQIWVVGVDGLGLRKLTSESYCDRPTWSPAPFNEIAYTARSSPGVFDIKVLDLASGERRQLTFGEGSNESPAYAPNGRHIAFKSTRTGKGQIFTINRTGGGLRQVTRSGNNEMPDWR